MLGAIRREGKRGHRHRRLGFDRNGFFRSVSGHGRQPLEGKLVEQLRRDQVELEDRLPQVALVLGSVLLGRPDLVGSDESALDQGLDQDLLVRGQRRGRDRARSWNRDGRPIRRGRRRCRGIGRGCGQRVHVRDLLGVGNRRARRAAALAPRASQFAVCLVRGDANHDPRQDRIVPQTGDIAKKVPLRAIIFKAWYGRWQRADRQRRRANDKGQRQGRAIAERNWLPTTLNWPLAPRSSRLTKSQLADARETQKGCPGAGQISVSVWISWLE